MIIHPEPQGSLEWLQRRAGVITASEFDNILTADFQPRTGEMPRSYLARKLAEKWRGSSLAGFQSIDMDIGQILEEEAIPFYELHANVDITRVGLITTDDGRVGASPDGLIGDDSGIECKCPRPETHVKYLLSGTVPRDYLPQVHGALYITRRARWVFMSYCRGFPPLILTVQRDPEIIDAIGMALEEFLARFESEWARLEKLNGGPPRRPSAPRARPAPQPLHELELTP